MPTSSDYTISKKCKRQRLEKSSRIAIVGSGLGGLSAAICLEQAGFTNVTVYEKRQSDQLPPGYGLTLTYNPKGALAQMGLLEEVASRDCPSRSHYMFAKDGTILGYYGNAFTSDRGIGQRGNLRLPRHELRDIMVQHVKASILYGKRLVTFEPDPLSRDQSMLVFDDGTTESGVDLLVGADGMNSAVLKTLMPNGDDLLSYLGIFLILGISDFCHSLLDERGFYTLDGSHRLFTMPYQGSRIDKKAKRRIMWQLSFVLKDYQRARTLCSAGPAALQSLVLEIVKTWHDPVAELVRATNIDTIWGTGLMDRDPQHVTDKIIDSCSQLRVVILGDAIHPMSPFKGAGANQALLDGPLLATWLQRASLESAICGFLREMVQRTRTRVLASRKAAQWLHSPEVLAPAACHDFAGVAKERVAELLSHLRERHIGAHLGGELDASVQAVIGELGCRERESTNVLLASNSVDSSTALELASRGDTQGLRKLSLQCHPEIIRSARDDEDRSCLHLAVLHGHYETCKWLLTEVSLQDSVAMELARCADDSRIKELFS